MPTYDYVCKACGHALEIYQSITENAKRKCPACKKPKLERQLGSGAAILFKGSGFYQTDYRSDSYKSGEKADSKPKDAPASEPAKKDAPTKPAEPKSKSPKSKD
ncbi:MAG: zinc ribbon domain-containing protein [Planctomycetes bacterium]|nr:zinc ribbon domain-containing protein [Planctomycetota bacterium]